jgi:hypothetical protein
LAEHVYRSMGCGVATCSATLSLKSANFGAGASVEPRTGSQHRDQRYSTPGLPAMLVIILVVLFVLAVAGGGFGRSRYGGWSWSPALIILLIAVVLLLTGQIRIG